MIFVCPSLKGCCPPAQRLYEHFIGADNIDEARDKIIEHIEYNNCEEVFFVDEIIRNERCIELEEIFNGLNRMMKKEI